MTNKNISDIVSMMNEMCEDTGVPRNVKTKFQEIINALNSNKLGNISVTVNKALQDLDEISDDSNLQPYVRTQIWNVVTMLEKVN